MRARRNVELVDHRVRVFGTLRIGEWTVRNLARGKLEHLGSIRDDDGVSQPLEPGPEGAQATDVVLVVWPRAAPTPVGSIDGGCTVNLEFEFAAARVGYAPALRAQGNEVQRVQNALSFDVRERATRTLEHPGVPLAVFPGEHLRPTVEGPRCPRVAARPCTG